MTPAVAVVTGGGAGLGRVITRRLAADGRHVVVADRDEAAARDTTAEVVASGGAATATTVDVTDDRHLERLLDDVATLGRLEVLVNNAGGWLPGPQFPDAEDWTAGLDLNLRAPMRATQLALPLLQLSRGAVVNIASSGGWDTGAYGSPEYGAAKAGLIRFTTAVADLDARLGVRVSCVVPFWVGLDRAREQYARMTDEEQRHSGGLVDPEVVAETVRDLAADPTSAGRVVVLRADRPVQTIDPAPRTD